VYSFGGHTLLDFATEDDIVDFISERWRIAHKKKQAPRNVNKVISDMHAGWRPMTLDTPITFAPPTVVALVVQCCHHDPTRRPTFEQILRMLEGPCKAEIDNGSFGRRPLTDDEADVVRSLLFNARGSPKHSVDRMK
jgi:hypothetical protein